MAGANTAVTVATSATRLDTVSETDDRQGSSVALYNSGSSTVYIGTASNVTTTTGAPVAAGSWGPSFDLAPNEGLWGVVASGTGTMIVIETGI